MPKRITTIGNRGNGENGDEATRRRPIPPPPPVAAPASSHAAAHPTPTEAATAHVEQMAYFPQQATIPHAAPLVLWLTFAALVVLLVLTVGLYYIDLSHYIPIPGINLIAALIVATFKASLVIMFFMNVRNSTRLTWLYVGLGFLWLLVMAGIFMDYQTRAWLSPPGWE